MDENIKPSKFNFRDKNRNISTDGFICENIKNEIGLIRTDFSIQPFGYFYFEIEILEYENNKSKVSVGCCLKSNITSSLPGFDKNSFGYKSTDGNKLSDSMNGEIYGSSYEEGDTVGVFLNFITNSIFFTKNGVAFRDAFFGISKLNLFPSVGLYNAKIKGNFGKEKFKFDIEPILSESKLFVHKSIEKENISISEINYKEIILEYLYKNGYLNTCEVLGKKYENDFRKGILESILNGNYNESINLIEKYYPFLLDKLLFPLKSQIFIEMKKDEDSLSFAKKELSKYLNTKYEKDLMKIFSLISLNPLCQINESIEIQRLNLSNLVNKTILENEKIEEKSKLSKMLKHLKLISSLNFDLDITDVD
eukprot:gene4855-8440_t